MRTTPKLCSRRSSWRPRREGRPRGGPSPWGPRKALTSAVPPGGAAALGGKGVRFLVVGELGARRGRRVSTGAQASRAASGEPGLLNGWFSCRLIGDAGVRAGGGRRVYSGVEVPPSPPVTRRESASPRGQHPLPPSAPRGPWPRPGGRVAAQTLGPERVRTPWMRKPPPGRRPGAPHPPSPPLPARITRRKISDLSETQKARTEV